MTSFTSHWFFLIFFSLTGSIVASPPPDWQTVTSVEALWQAYPERLHTLFQALDLQQPALDSVRLALHQEDTVQAAKFLLSYYRQTNRNWVISALDSLPEEEAMAVAHRLVEDSVSFDGSADQVPRHSMGGWQWSYTGPRQDDEFGYSLNGHKYLPALFLAWQETDSTRYAHVFDELMRDWIIHHPLPAPDDSIYLVVDTTQGLDWRDIGEVEWRTLEAGNRLGASWPQLFYGFQSSESFSPAARLLMLASIAEQATYLHRYHKQGHNWTTMEMNGLALAGLAFPEFKEANRWANYALQIMTEEINRQVYPDGVQTELSTKTQWVALNRFESIATNFQKAGQEMSEAYVQRLEEMYNYLAYSMRPDGHQPLNNDSDREDLRQRVLKAAEKFNRPDWQWIATNGKAGQAPDSLPSVVFPWAGIHVMRNSWDEQAHWAFFDVGPFGTGHQHADKLQLSVAAYGKDLLVDGGRYTHQDYFSFDPTLWRGYFRSSFSHNIILVDGKGQSGGPVRVEAPLREKQDYTHQPAYDFARGAFTDGFEDVAGKAEHTRSVLYLRDQYWIVLDHFDTDRPRTLQALWHYAPTCQVVLEESEAVSTNVNEANLRIVPIGEVAWQTDIVSGQEEPFKQGWYSAEYGVKEPNPTVVYTTNIAQPTTFAWLLVPAPGVVPKIFTRFQQEEDGIVLSIEMTDQPVVNVSIPLTEGLPVVEKTQ
uniref:Alginate lyase family protein n=1 Tax=Roseihalotalea indica TaxID=2867963 RepID=A0AA49GJT2_9BACT|nr:alginate lyase family protein [Tunicatimonas sp. TK19036]